MTTYIYKYVINALQQGEELWRVLLCVCGMFLLMIFYNILLQVKNVLWETEGLKLEKSLQAKLQKKARAADLESYETPRFYDKFTRASADPSGLALQALNNLCNLIVNVITLLSIGALILSIDIIYLLLALLPAVVTLLVGRRRNDLLHEKDVRTKEAARKKEYVRRVFYLRDYAKELRLTDMYQVMFGQMRESILQQKEIAARYGYGIMWVESLLGAFYEIFVYFGAIILALYQTLVTSAMLYGDAFVVINSVTQISYMIGDVGSVLTSFGETSLHIDDLREFLEAEPKIGENPEGQTPEPFRELEVNHLSFTYSGQERCALHNISLQVRKGEKIAIVGENGSGKTTLVKLLLRLYDPDVDGGEILFNGRALPAYQLGAYRNVYSTVFQDFRMFAVSVAENVMGKGHVSAAEREKVEEALRTVGLFEKIAAFPEGMDTIVSKEFDENGIVFSGGEAQKLAIARAMARDAQIVILDEPSSALDPIAENEMFDKILEVCRDRTVIFISHHLFSATLADRIYLLEAGELKEQGTHSQLLARNGSYADLWNKQAEKYKAGKAG